MSNQNIQIPNSHIITLTPVTKNADYKTGPILIAFIIIGILIGISLYLFVKNHHNEYERGGGHMTLGITNETFIPYDIKIGSETNKTYKTIDPGQELKLSISQHEIVNAYSYNFDGTPIHHQIRVSNNKINKLFITSSGFRTNLSGSENVIFTNEASFPVMFIEKSSKGGRRWASSILLPGESTGEHFVGKRTTWQVAVPDYEDEPIAELTISGNVEKIVFNGDHFKSF